MRPLGMSFAVLLWASVAHAQADKDKDKDKDEEKDKDKDKDKDKEPAVQEISPDEPDTTKPPTTPAPPATTAKMPDQTPSASHLTTLDEMTIPKSFLRFGINFFGDTSFTLTSPSTPASSFSIASLGIRLLGELSPSLDALAEFALETNEGTGPVADVEQLAIRWRGGPGELEVGRFHTDIGYWNTAFHHGRWLQMTVERPHVVRFEDDGGLVPVHWVGAAYTLGKKSDLFAATIGVGNGRGNIVDDVRVRSDTNEAKAIHLKGRIKSGSVEAGVGFIYDLIAPADMMIRPALPDKSIHELIGNGYFVVRSEGVVVMADGYAFRHQAGSQSWMSYGGYAHLGYHVSDLMTPYLGVDTIRGADKDPFFHPSPMTEHHDMIEGIAGLRIETSTWSALKLETHLEHSYSTKQNEYEGILNWSFGL